MKDKDSYYSEMRRLANDNLVRSATSLDRIIFVATTGALVLASGLVQKFQNPTILLSVILAISIVSLLLALLVHSIAYQKSIQYNKLTVKNLDEWYESVKHINEANLVMPFDLPKPNITVDENGRTKYDNWSFRLMWLGISLLALFVALNLINTNRHESEKYRHTRYEVSR